MNRLMSHLIAQRGCMLYGNEIILLLPDCEYLSHREFAEILVNAEGIADYELGTKYHLRKFNEFQSVIEQHFPGESVPIDEVRQWAVR